MNKVIKGLLVAALLVSANAGAYTNKTFLMPRNNALVNLPLEQTTWAERIHAPLEDRFGGNFQVVGFYGQNTNKSDTGKYFGITEKNDFKLIATAAAIASSTADLDPAYILHNHNATAAERLSVKLDPELINYGVDLAYYQDLSKIVNGLYLKVNLPIAHVETDPKLAVTEIAAEDEISRANLVSFFKGNTYTQAAENAQNALTKAKIDGKHSATGVADIDIMLGYNFLKKESYHIGLNIGISIPTGKEPTGDYMFEPIYGSKHFGLGGGLTAAARIWGDEDHNFKLNFAAN